MDDAYKKAARRWAYLLDGNVCVSHVENMEGKFVGLFVSTPVGSKTCETKSEVEAFIDACINGDFYNPTVH